MNTLSIKLLINDIPLVQMQQCNIPEIPLNIQYLFNEFVKQVNNVLENGYCGNEKLVDSINNGKFTGWNKYCSIKQ